MNWFCELLFSKEEINEHFMRYKNGCEGARREGSCRCPYKIKGISAQIPDDESLSAGQGFHYFKLGT